MNNRKFNKMCFIAIIIAVINVLFRSNMVVGYITVALEVVSLLYLAIKKDVASYIAYYLVFVCNCMEFNDLTQEEMVFYNIKDIRIAGINLAAIMLIPLLFISIPQLIKVKNGMARHDLFYKYGSGLIVLNTIALFTGILLVALNDNNIDGVSSNIWGTLLKEAYATFWIPFVGYFAVKFVKEHQNEKLDDIRIALQATIYGCFCQMMVSLFFGIRGYYGGIDTTLVVSVVSLFFPFFILFGLEKKTVNYPKLTLLIGAVGTILLLVYNASGKAVLSAGLVIIVLIVQKLRTLKPKTITIILCLVLICGIGAPIIIRQMMEKNLLLKIKVEQALSMLDIFSGSWRENMAISTRARLEEILDVFIEFRNKPYLAITGKGYLGSITDLTGFFKTTGDFTGFVSEAEWNNGTYYNLHEIASNLLMFGALGAWYTLSFIRKGIRQYKKNPWIIIGIFWWSLIFGYSFTQGLFGAICFYYALIIPRENITEGFLCLADGIVEL